MPSATTFVRSKLAPTGSLHLRSEHYRAVLNHDLENVRHVNAASLENFKAVIAAGQNAIRSIILINGGASVAMLAFLGHLVRIGSPQVPQFAGSLVAFVTGTLLGTLVAGSTYLAQFFFGYPDDRERRVGLVFNVLAVAIAILSYLTFFAGSYTAYQAFTDNPPLFNPALVQLLGD